MKYKIFLTFNITYNNKKIYYIDYLDLYHKIEVNYNTCGVYSYILDNNFDRINYHFRMINQLVKPINKRNLKYYE